MKINSNIPDCTYSLSRLKLELKNKLTPDKFWLAGWCVVRDSNVSLMSQGELVNICNSERLIELQGQMICLQVSIHALHLDAEGVATVSNFEKILDLGGDPDEMSFYNAKVTPSVIKKYSQYLSLLRSGLSELGLVEVVTPSLVTCPGSEPSLDPVRVGDKYLPTSPELHLKKYLAAGYTDIYEIKRCFRAEELSPIHESEFLMLEWYRGFADLKLIKADLNALLIKLSSGAIEAVKTYSVAQLFSKVINFDLTPETSREQLLVAVKELSLDYELDDSFNDLFFRLMIEKIEPWMARQSFPIFLEKYPPSQAALALLDSDGWADRFELYWKGVELANAFSELTDPIEQRSRFKKDNEEKLLLGKQTVNADEDFFKALERGLPPSGGIALGVERLFLVLNNLSSLDELNLFRQHS